MLFGFGRREIHSSERRKPSEVSLRLSMVPSISADGLAPVSLFYHFSARDLGIRCWTRGVALELCGNSLGRAFQNNVDSVQLVTKDASSD